MAGSDRTERGRRRRVAMVVANDVSTDTRVRKMARDLAATGKLEVTVLGVSSSGRREDHPLGQATITLLPVDDRLRTLRRLGRGFGRRHWISHELAISRSNFFSYQRTAGALISWLRDDYFRSRTERNRLAGSRAMARIVAYRRLQEARLPSAVKRLARIGDEFERKWRERLRERSEKLYELGFRLAERRIRHRLTRRHRSYEKKREALQSRLLAAVEGGDEPDWRKALPELHDYEFAFGSVLDAIRPDVIHAQDVHLLGVAARAASRARWAGQDTKLVYDAHEYIAGLAHPRPAKAWTDLEAEYIGRADAVITVAPAIADLLQSDYQLRVRPTVVMNIPAEGSTSARNLREEVGLSEDTPLLVYSGGMDATRGVHTLVEAVSQIPDVHLALVSKAATNYTLGLKEVAREGGYEDRVHFTSFVDPHDVPSFLSSADIGVHTIVSGPLNHEVTLPNKVFEYMHARLPIVISDCKAMSDLVSELGIGEVFVSENVDSLAGKISKVLRNVERYRGAYQRQPDLLEAYSWQNEREKLYDIYRRLLGNDVIAKSHQHEELAPLQDVR